MYSGLQPAITALIATFSTVQGDEVGRDQADDLVGLALGAAQHAQDALVGRRHDRQPVAPAALEAGLDRIVPFADRDRARLAGRGRRSARSAPRARRARRSWSRSPAATPAGPSPCGGGAGEPHPFGAIPAHGALDLAAAFEADQGRHGLDVEVERALEIAGRRSPGRRRTGKVGSSWLMTASGPARSRLCITGSTSTQVGQSRLATMTRPSLGRTLGDRASGIEQRLHLGIDERRILGIGERIAGTMAPDRGDFHQLARRRRWGSSARLSSVWK